MYNVIATIELNDLAWSSEWAGYEVCYPESEIVCLYTQERDDGIYNFYIDTETNKVLDFWKDDGED